MGTVHLGCLSPSLPSLSGRSSYSAPSLQPQNQREDGARKRDELTHYPLSLPHTKSILLSHILPFMASQRTLKKEIIAEVMRLFDEALIIRAVSASEAMQSEIEDLMDDIMVFTDDSLRRVTHPSGKDNPRLVKAYYKALRYYIATNLASLSERLDDFVEGL